MCFRMSFSYFYFTLNMLLIVEKPSDIIAVKISINQNITGLAGNNNTHITCFFTIDENGNLENVGINTVNKEGFHTSIVKFLPENAAIVNKDAKYLHGRVTLTNITYMSTNATMTFDELKCEDEKNYVCTLAYNNKLSGKIEVKSKPTRVSVKVSPSKPDFISSFIVSSTKWEKQEDTSSSFLGERNSSFSTKQNDRVSFRTLPSDTVTGNPLTLFREGDTVKFTCTGNIGNPPGNYIWQMISPQQDQPRIYFNETTEKENISEKCFFRGTSNLTVHISTDHLKAKFRCFEESQADVVGMYIETPPLDVQFHVRYIYIDKQPNQKQYNKKIDKITLTCNGSGNPEPNYIWFKDDNKTNILSWTNICVIDDVIQNNSGVYTCEANNIIDNVNYRNSTSVEINIMDELLSSPDSALLKIFLVYVIPVLCAILFVVTCAAVITRCCIRPKRKEKEEGYCRKCSYDGITLNPEYTSVIHKNITTAGEPGELGFNNEMEGNKNKSRNKQEDLIKTADVNPNLQTTSFHTPVYAVPSDALQAKNITCKIPLGMSSFKDLENI